VIEIRGVEADEREAFFVAHSTGFGRIETPERCREVAAVLAEPLYRLTGAYEDGQIVGTALDQPFALTVRPGVTVPCRGLTWVAVLPTHRRRGVMRALVEEHLADCRARGAAASLLHSVVSGLYRPFGYGVAARRARLTVATAHAGFRDDAAAPLAIRLVEPTDAIEHYQAVWARCRLARPGFTDRLDADARWLLDDHEGFMVTCDDGYALYTLERRWVDGHPCHRLTVVELIAATPPAYAALWRYVLGMANVTEVVAEARAVDEPLPHLLVEPRRADLSHLSDGLWLNPLDREQLCAARGLADPGVDDEAFANLLLGASSPSELADAGRIAPGVAREWVSDRAPWSPLDF
jgi:predicted acetyltransferase